MLTPGELERGLWVMVHSLREETAETPWQESQPDNTLMGLFASQKAAVKQVQDCPFLILGVELPYLVVAHILMNPYGTFIWDTREYNLMEVSPEFVQAYTPQGFDQGQIILKNTARQPVK